MILVRIPIRLPSLANARWHWRARAKIIREHRGLARLLVGAGLAAANTSGLELRGQALVIVIVRIAPRRLDTDNLSSACKGVRDGVADALGISDGDAQHEWRYEQRRDPKAVGSAYPTGYGTEITVSPRYKALQGVTRNALTLRGGRGKDRRP